MIRAENIGGYWNSRVCNPVFSTVTDRAVLDSVLTVEVTIRVSHNVQSGHDAMQPGRVSGTNTIAVAQLEEPWADFR